jgi:hypothetical protein
MGWDKVSDEEEDRHHDVLSDGYDVGSGNLGDGDVVLVGSVQVNVASRQLGTLIQVEGTYSDPTPAVTASLSFFAFSKRSAVRYPGWKGVVTRISVYRVSLVRVCSS